MTTFSPANETHTALIEQLARDTWPDTFGQVMPAAQIEYMLTLIYNDEALRAQMNQGHQFLIIKYKDEPVGYTSYELNYKGIAQLMIHKVYILPTRQGLGIGKSTFQHLTNIALNHQQESLTLKVFYKNENAMAFYLKKGFEDIGIEEGDIGKGYIIIDHVMRKTISS